MAGAERGRHASRAWQRVSAIRASHVKVWVLSRFPILQWVPRYSVKNNLGPDTVSGLMLAVHQVAQGLAFGLMSSVHPVFGLYTSLIPPFMYAVFGMGRHVATGTFALTSLISAGAVERLVPPNNSNFTTTNESGVLGLSDFEMKKIGVAAAVTFLGGIIQVLWQWTLADDTKHRTGILGLSDFEMKKIGVAAAVTFLGGIIQVAMFALHLGSVTFLMAEPMISSMTTGAATHGLNALVKHLLGLRMPFISGPFGMFRRPEDRIAISFTSIIFLIYAYVFYHIRSVKVEAAITSLLCIVLLLFIKKMNEKYKTTIKIMIPVDLFLMIAASLACYFANMEHAYGFDVLGHIPKGMPTPQAPPMSVLPDIIAEGFGLGFAGYAASLFLAQGSAKKFRYSIDDNQEILAHGLSNVVASFFFCIPSAAAMGRSAVLYGSGAKTQVASLVSCVVVLLVIYVAAPLLCWLPMCVLASVVVVALKGMLLQFLNLRKYWNTDKTDCVIWICTYLVTICYSASVGLLFGVIFNIVIVAGRLTRAKIFHINSMEDEDCKVLENLTYGGLPPGITVGLVRELLVQTNDSRSVYTTCAGNSGACNIMELSQRVKIVSIGLPLCFLNAKKFQADLQKINMTKGPSIQLRDFRKEEQNPLRRRVSHEAMNGVSDLTQTMHSASCALTQEETVPSPPHRTEIGTLILNCKGLTFFDYTGVSTLVQVYMHFKKRGVNILLVHCKQSLTRAMQYNGLDLDSDIFFDSVASAVSSVNLHKSSTYELSDECEV